MESLSVIKLGGNALVGDALVRLVADIHEACATTPMVLVHGAGPTIQSTFEQHGYPSRFVDGLRYTPEGSEELVVQSLQTQNSRLVQALNHAFVVAGHKPRAVGVSAVDGCLINARVLDAQRYGMVGAIDTVECSLLTCLLRDSWLPVIAPFGYERKSNKLLNINSDTAATKIAQAMGAHRLVFVTNVPGILDAEGQVIDAITTKEIDVLIEQSVISGGMLPKVQAAQSALLAWCQQEKSGEGSGAGQVVITDSPAKKGTTITAT